MKEARTPSERAADALLEVYPVLAAVIGCTGISSASAIGVRRPVEISSSDPLAISWVSMRALAYRFCTSKTLAEARSALALKRGRSAVEDAHDAVLRLWAFPSVLKWRIPTSSCRVKSESRCNSKQGGSGPAPLLVGAARGDPVGSNPGAAEGRVRMLAVVLREPCSTWY